MIVIISSWGSFPFFSFYTQLGEGSHSSPYNLYMLTPTPLPIPYSWSDLSTLLDDSFMSVYIQGKKSKRIKESFSQKHEGQSHCSLSKIHGVRGQNPIAHT